MKIISALLLSQFIYASSLEIKLKDLKCHTSEMGQLFLSQSSQSDELKVKKIIYQVELPLNGTARFNLPDGKYHLSYVTEKGCNVEKEVELKGDSKIDLEVMK